MTETVSSIIWDVGKLSICQRTAHKARWLLREFVGGKVEPGETKKQALVREYRGELGINVAVGDVFTDVTHVYPDLIVTSRCITPAKPTGSLTGVEGTTTVR